MERAEELEKYPLMHDIVDKWAKIKPDDLAIIEYNTGAEIPWKQFKTSSKAFAAKLLSLGIKKGDVVATSLALLKEHIYLMYGCFRIGAIIAPLDPRLKSQEIIRAFDKIKPKVYMFLGKTEVADFRDIVKPVMEAHKDTVKYWVQFQKEPELVMDGAIGIGEFAADIKKVYLLKGILGGAVKRASKKVDKRDPCLIIFTTGSTGWPKPALLCHENILLQNISLGTGFEMRESDRMLVNLPPSHVGCTTEQLATTIYGGGTAVILHIFKPDHSLDAIQKYKVTCMGQIPALFSMEWRLPNYDDYDLSSLRFCIAAGQQVTRAFLEKLSTMAKQYPTGLGLTETAGFCTYTPMDYDVDDLLKGIGYDSPLCPISIREMMKKDGSAGDEKPKEEIGEICFEGPQIFLGYMDDVENTRKTISTDGILYTGDLGSYDEEGLHFAGRSKLLIKPKGYNVYPQEVEDFIGTGLKEKVSSVAVVGVPHDVFTEGIMAFVETRKGEKVTKEEIDELCKEMASYKRPSHVEILEPEQMPLNRVSKTDYVTLKDKSKEIAKKLREQGGWDA
ncbi:MAG: acyl--CoA ligase [Candidatus Lokiarchaeota archaeon]|nr:acyl--CoA ligase [Candidatus Lokiarchaeota archaeon]